MSKMIQLRHVPDALHKRLRARAAMAGMTLSDCRRMPDNVALAEGLRANLVNRDTRLAAAPGLAQVVELV
jgi:plasmid stability protein